MSTKILAGVFLVLVGFAAGLGISQWEKVETVNFIFYIGMLIVIFAGMVLFGFEIWRYSHNWRRMVDKQHENYSTMSAIPTRMPPLPRFEELPANAQSLEAIEALF
jgi:O-antigen ligase